MRLASDSTEPLPHAEICNHWHTISSMVGLPLKSIYPSSFEHFGTSEKSSVSQTASFWKPLEPLSPLHYAHPCWPRSIIHNGVPNTAFVSQETPCIFWPSMSKVIEEFCHSCPTSAQYGKQAATEPMLSHPTPTLPWQFVSQDIIIYVRPQTVFNHSGSLQWLLLVGRTSRHPINHRHQSY